MRNKKLIPVMSVITSVLLLTVIVLMLTIGPWKKTSDDGKLKPANEGTEASLTTEQTSAIVSDTDNSVLPVTPTEDTTASNTPDSSSSKAVTEVTIPDTTESETAAPSPTSAPTPTPTPSPTPEPTKTPTPEPTKAPEKTPEQTKPVSDPGGSYDLSGMVIVLDPGHQKKANSDQEAVAPWSSETKAKVSSGTSGVSTKRPEYEVVLEIALKVRDKLQSMGATVIMTRTTNDVNISNIERAKIATDNNADVFIRLHCDSSESSSSRGIGVFVCSKSDFADQKKWGDWLGNCLSNSTGSKFRGTVSNTTYSGLNWATSVPSFLLEMGFMSNSEDDRLLSDPAYQEKICNGVAAFCNKMKNR